MSVIIISNMRDLFNIAIINVTNLYKKMLRPNIVPEHLNNLLYMIVFVHGKLRFELFGCFNRHRHNDKKRRAADR